MIQVIPEGDKTDNEVEMEAEFLKKIDEIVAAIWKKYDTNFDSVLDI